MDRELQIQQEMQRLSQLGVPREALREQAEQNVDQKEVSSGVEQDLTSRIGKQASGLSPSGMATPYSPEYLDAFGPSSGELQKRIANAPPVKPTDVGTGQMTGSSNESQPSDSGFRGGSPASGDLTSNVTRSLEESKRSIANAPSDSKLRQALSEYRNQVDALGGKLNVDTTDLTARLDAADQEYVQTRDRNDLLSVVQKIGQALAKYGTYRAGKRAGIALQSPELPSYDFEAATERARREKGDLYSRVGKERDERIAATRDEYQSEKDRLAGAREQVDTERYLYGQEGDRLSEARREARSDARDTKAGIDYNRRFGSQDYDNAQAEERALLNKEKAMSGLINAIAADTKESRKKIPILAGQAGVDPAEIERAAEETKERGMILDSANPAAQAEAVKQSLLKPLQDEIAAIRERKRIAQEMMATGKSREEAAAASGARPSQVPTSGLRKPSDADVEKYMSMYPQVSREQAIQILTDRLNASK